MRGMNSATARYARAVVSSSWVWVIWISGCPTRTTVAPASASLAIAAPSTRSQPNAASSPISAFSATQVANPSTSAWLSAGVSGPATVRPSNAHACATSSSGTPSASAAVRRL